MTAPDHTLQTRRKRPFRNSTRDTLQTLPHRITYHLFRFLSKYLLGVSFNNDAELQNWLNDIFTDKPADFFKRGIDKVPERWEAVLNNGEEYVID
jgi:hypothetical protein